MQTRNPISQPLTTKMQLVNYVNEFSKNKVRAYARMRNYDYGKDRHIHVSRLSPYMSRRMITELEVIKLVLGHNNYQSVDKFIEEVCWRTYWRGWLRHHPYTWQNYRKKLDKMRTEWSEDQGYQRALQGHTGIECYDAWIEELRSTGYLHNHARMWTASIWINTLNLPWELGADLFFHHLLDADPASNTLSWRWVAGLHSKGKYYLARKDNIEKFTEGRFSPQGLVCEAKFIDRDEADFEIVPYADARPPRGKEKNWIIWPDDWSVDQILYPDRIESIALIHPNLVYKDMSHQKSILWQILFDDVKSRHASISEELVVISSWDDMQTYCSTKSRLAWVTPAVGPIQDLLTEHAYAFENVLVNEYIRPWDKLLFPYCQKGYFALKKHLPGLIQKAVEP